MRSDYSRTRSAEQGVVRVRGLRLFENESVNTYAQAAELIGVCRGRVWQLVSLVTRLPKEVTDFLAANKDPFIRAHFSERRLRPLTLLESDE